MKDNLRISYSEDVIKRWVANVHLMKNRACVDVRGISCRKIVHDVHQMALLYQMIDEVRADKPSTTYN
jgi:hypothetical protein